jgi:hypothetical protein
MSEDQLSAVVRKAVSEGLRDAWSDPEFWAAAVTAIQSRAQTHAGGWLFGGIRTVVSRAAWLTVIGLGVYLLGGWGALVALFKAVVSGAGGS